MFISVYRELFFDDPIAAQLIRDAASGFTKDKSDRDLLKNVKKESKRLAEEFVNSYFLSNLTPSGAESITKELEKIRMTRKIKDNREELAQIYKGMRLIRDYSSKEILIDHPQVAADPLILRACPPSIIDEFGKTNNINVEPLTGNIRKTLSKLGISCDELQNNLLFKYQDYSSLLKLPFFTLNATKVYLMGCVFYGNSGDGWTLTFATGSGLPDPLEWNGSLWFCRRYNIPMAELYKIGLHEKNLFRSLNFNAGIISPLWHSKRIYFWQRSKTSDQLKTSYKLAFNFGKGSEYIKDAVNQMIRVFSAPNLKIIELDKFEDVLAAWTRVSKRDVMLSCRPGSAERQIEHAIWLTPGIRLGDAMLHTLMGFLIPLTSYLVAKENIIAKIISMLAVASIIYFGQKELRSEQRNQAAAIRNLQKTIDKYILEIWKNNNLFNIVKIAQPYSKEEAVRLSIKTIADLLRLEPNQVNDVYFYNTEAPSLSRV